MAVWVDSGPADYEIQIKVINFRTLETIRSKEDRTLLYSTTLSIEGIVYEGGSNREVWRSGYISYSEQLEAPDSKQISGDVIEQTIRKLADKMRSTF